MLVTSSVFLVEYRIKHLPEDEACKCGCNWDPFQVFYDIKPGFYIGQKMWHLDSESTLFHLTWWLPVHPFFYKWHNLSFFYGWIKLHCVYMPRFLYPLICWWASRLVPYLTMMTRALAMEAQAPMWCAGLDSSGTESAVRSWTFYLTGWGTSILIPTEATEYPTSSTPPHSSQHVSLSSWGQPLCLSAVWMQL